MRSRAMVLERDSVRPAWNWDSFTPSTVLGWAALGLVAVHVGTLVVMQAFHAAFWAPSGLWDDAHVVAAATAYAVSAIGAGGLALLATLRREEHSVLMLVPVLLGSFWAFWLLHGLPVWL